MRNFKDIILEKLKVTNNIDKLPDIEEFSTAIYSYNNGHDVEFKDIDPKYRDITNCPTYENDGKLYYVFSIYVSKPMNHNKFLYVFCSSDVSPIEKNFMIYSMDHLIEVLGEELILQIWYYIN